MLGQHVRQFGEKLARRRPVEPRNGSEISTPHLNIFSLVVFGVNRTLRVGVYILAGVVAVYVAGPAIIISLLVAGVFNLLSGFYLAELGAWVPRSGSVYFNSYVTMGQLHAFITGWTLILPLVLATAYLTRAWSYNFDSLIGNHISQKLEEIFSEHMPSFLAPYPDFVALALVLVMAGLLILGVHGAALVSKVSAGFNVLLLSFITLSGFIKGDLHNWQLTEQDYKLAASGSSDSYSLGLLGSGEFVPFGFEGILRGAALPFYSYFGLNAIVTKGRETPNPQRSIPWSLGIIISICFLAYSGVSAALTLMVPYYQVHPNNPLPQAFHHVGWAPAGYFVAVVILCALFYSLLLVMLTMSRLICAMAEDGLLFRGLSQTYARRGTPIVAILVSATLSGILAVLFEIFHLLELMSIGTLFVYFLVTFSVLVLRYQPDQNFSKKEKVLEEIEMEPIVGASPLESVPEAGTSNPLKSLCNPISTTPTRKSGQIVYGCAFLLVLLLTILSLLLALWPSRVFSGDPGFTAGAVLLLLLIAGITAIIWRQPQNPSPLPFRVPALPILPVLSIFLNVYLMMQLSSVIWAEFGIWNAVGFAIYFGYGIRHSLEEKRDPQLPASTSQTLHEHTPGAESS
ncbi:cationic amino acid transporter 3-like isoform X1 [Sus scrofa]|uniref:cationic amino acid transporter 3-like isoform X1 n=1 Tax=Sus scrofa TaxID=9823 RepID=UPI000A2B267E|nr:cationic amino acid transporter 3-like isoform X1 [Sus scrofa]XP_013854200.2 cationic amino acid transporter 3-like isoform X1 [Sus scrofa]